MYDSPVAVLLVSAWLSSAHSRYAGGSSGTFSFCLSQPLRMARTSLTILRRKSTGGGTEGRVQVSAQGRAMTDSVGAGG